MSSAEQVAFDEGVESGAADRVVFGRGVWSVLAGEPQADSERYLGRALPALLRERWAIRATVAVGEGTYFILARKDPQDLEPRPTQRPGPSDVAPRQRAPFWSTPPSGLERRTG